MNVAFASIPPLPAALSRPSSLRRRHLVGGHDLDPGALRHFNELIAMIDFDRAPLEIDQVASAARELIDRPRDGAAPACIRKRMRRAGALDLMLSDPEWEPLALASLVAAVVVDYMRSSASLIPNGLPVVGRLDDAVMVETAWPSAEDEVRNYLDFCRLRRVEAELRREKRLHFGFTRDQWLVARQAEADWVMHIHHVGTSTYVPATISQRFRIS